MGTQSSVSAGVSLRSPDGVRLVAALTRSSHPSSTAIVLVPGFSGWSQKPGVARTVRVFAEQLDVFQIDLRGHGRSDGLSTLADREVLDVDAAVAHVRGLGYERVVTVGFSMGGAAVIRHAALVGEQVRGYAVEHQVDAVVCVSTGSAWYIRDTKPMRRLHWLVLTRPGRVVARRVFHVRIDPNGWGEHPLSPTEAAAKLTVPLLVVHGDSDAYLRAYHGQVLKDAAAGPVELWLEAGFGHAEEAADPVLLRRIADAIPGLVEQGSFRGAALDD